ncbi:glycosyltransferase [Echinicola soli]|uniref:Glycosyltransferase n=1 Tax=Echinicola soli TaxID=2591634 RepID=A0A514CIZ8_9BACT|nr:glycosyltransferase [Echinicola soli]QDH79802.1 glycosyltransferase [Echinicola soli]
MEERSLEKPLVTVVMPVYNGARYLNEAIDSILIQTYESFELIIVNDGSSDDSEAIILRYEDSRINYVRNEQNVGLIRSLNKGIDLAKGKYIARMDQDDISVSSRFERQVAFLESHSDVAICGMQGQILQTGEQYKVPTQDGEIRGLLFFGSPFIHPVVMIRTETLVNNDLRYDFKYNHAEDFGLWVNLSFVGKLSNLNEVGIHYRQHELQYTKVFKEDNFDASFSAKLEYLERLGMQLGEFQLALYERINRKAIDPCDKKGLSVLAGFYKQFRKLNFPNNVEVEYLEKLIYKKWKVTCADGIKQRVNTYFLFLSNGLVYKYFEPKVHLWFLKKLMIK